MNDEHSRGHFQKKKRWRKLPDPTRQWEVLHRSFVYDRRAGTLVFHRDLPYCDRYDHATDAIIHRVATAPGGPGGVRLMLKLGCDRTFPPDKPSLFWY